jgi:hypothetical protein
VRHHVVHLTRDPRPFLGHGRLGVTMITLECRRPLLGSISEQAAPAKHHPRQPGERPHQRDAERLVRGHPHILERHHDDPGERHTQPCHSGTQWVVRTEGPEGEHVRDDAPVLARSTGYVQKRDEHLNDDHENRHGERPSITQQQWQRVQHDRWHQQPSPGKVGQHDLYQRRHRDRHH